ncbi:MAG: lipoprotein [Pseudomonadales bacterium]|jgi:predicted small lipoprotein YifL|nr:lipoprotein [Pseudomonadales bacterium]
MRLLALSFLTLLLSSCGQKGPLYLPEVKAESEIVTDVQATSETTEVQQTTSNRSSKKSTIPTPQN